MKTKQIYICTTALLLMLCHTSSALAYTVEWVIPPEDMQIENLYSTGLYQYIYHDDCVGGIFDPQANDLKGKVLFKYDNIFVAPYFGDNIIGIYDSQSTEFLGLIDRQHHFVEVPKGLFRYGQYFADGDLVSVWNSANRIGYLDLKGNLVVKCQFRDGKPFRNGWAFVKNEKDEWMYINTDWDKTKKTLKVKGGKIDEGRQVKDGITFIRQKHKWKKISVTGDDLTPSHAVSENLEAEAFFYSENYLRSKEIDEHPEKSNSNVQPNNGNINIYTAENNLIGYTCEGKMIVPVQFLNENPENFDGDYVVVKQRDSEDHLLQGLLRKIDGDFTTISADSLMRRDGKGTFKASFNYPASLDASKLRVMVIGGDNEPVDATTQEFKNGVCNFSWKPDAGTLSSLDDCELTWQVYADYGLLLWEESKVVSFVEVKKASVGSFYQESTTPQQKQTIWVNVNNPAGNAPLKATFSLSNSQGTIGTTSKTLPAGTNARLHLTVDAKQGGKVNASVTLGNGQTARSQVLTITPYKASYKPPVKQRVVVQKTPQEKTQQGKTKKFKDLW